MATDDRTLPAAPAGYAFERFDAPAVSPAMADEVVSFLGGFGPHFNCAGATWGPDYRARLTAPSGAAAVVAAAARAIPVGRGGENEHDGADSSANVADIARGEIAAHACVLYSVKRPAVGALFHVCDIATLVLSHGRTW